MPDLPGTAIARARTAKSIDDALYLIVEHLREVYQYGVNLRGELDNLAHELERT